jgi:hypothetical protein
MEAAGLACVALWPFILLAILVASSVTVAGGSIGLLSSWKQRGKTWELSLIVLAIGLIPLILCGSPMLFPQPPKPPRTPEPEYKLTDEVVKPFIQAINQSNRLSLGFSPIPHDATVIKGCDGSKDSICISYGPSTGWGNYSNWMVFFKGINDGYVWIGEQETHAGPHRYENIYISYFTDLIPGCNCRPPEAKPNNILIVEYRGEDPRLKKPNLTLEDIRPVLIEWKEAWARATPAK